MSFSTQARVPTALTEVFGIQHPIILAGMNVAAGPKLAAAVTNAGGLGVIGGVGYTPTILRKQIQALKKDLKDKNAPFGVDLLLPQVGGSARKTNTDYTKGQLPELIDIIIEAKSKLFVSAVGVPPKWAIEKLHAAGIFVMNMIGAPRHARKALALGVDIICAQGGEGGGHTGDIPTSILLPHIVDIVKGHKSPLTGEQVMVVGAGGIFDGRGLATALCMGADAVWVGTRFVASKEAGAPPRHKKGLVKCGLKDTIRTIIFTGRPMRVIKNDYIMDWESRPDDIKALTSKGIIPVYHDSKKAQKEKKSLSPKEMMNRFPLLVGQVAGIIDDVQPAAQIVSEMVETAATTLNKLARRSRL